MTVGVAILNKQGVALAADSAVTISSRVGGAEKVYYTANKLFTLSKYHPVGVMVYGNAEMMGIPWETIIKVYRARLGTKRLKRLEEYARDFIDFLDGNVDLFSEASQEEYLRLIILVCFEVIKEKLLRRVEEIIEREGAFEASNVGDLLAGVIVEELEDFRGLDQLPGIPDAYVDEFVRRHEDEIADLAQQFFENVPLSGDAIRGLTEIVASLFSRDHFLGNTTGIVIAGFGEDEVCPSLYEYQMECIVDNRLKYAQRRTARIGVDQSVVLVAFAQAEMVATFMDGFDPGYRIFSDRILAAIFERYPVLIVERIAPLLTRSQADDLRNALREISETIFNRYLEDMLEYGQENHVDPIINTVAFLPKDELASMAEALVNLTSVKHRVWKDVETVGGPIDVAVISKGDGFIWLQRKHYFKGELNHPFFVNYFREGTDETAE